jgi:alpha-mannosidase
MSAFKRAERGAALILRVFNPSESATSVLLKLDVRSKQLGDVIYWNKGRNV